MRHPIDLKRMRYIVEVARAQSITTAAETLGLTQPALTRSLGELEENLGIRLFHRLPRGMQVTDAGARFVARSRQILGEVDDLLADLSTDPETVSGRLRLAITPTSWLPFAAPVITELAGSHPGVRIEVINGPVQTLGPRLLHGDLDAIVASSRYLSPWRELDVHALMSLEFGCMVRRDHPITQIPEPEEGDILGYPAILPASTEPMYSDLAARYAHHNLPPLQAHYAIDDWGLIQDLVRCTNAFVPLLNIRSTEQTVADDFRVYRDLIEYPEHQVAMAFSNTQPQQEATRLFATLMKKRYRVQGASD